MTASMTFPSRRNFTGTRSSPRIWSAARRLRMRCAVLGVHKRSTAPRRRSMDRQPGAHPRRPGGIRSARSRQDQAGMAAFGGSAAVISVSLLEQTGRRGRPCVHQGFVQSPEKILQVIGTDADVRPRSARSSIAARISGRLGRKRLSSEKRRRDALPWSTSVKDRPMANFTDPPISGDTTSLSAASRRLLPRNSRRQRYILRPRARRSRGAPRRRRCDRSSAGAATPGSRE